jgi:hypothetical protein
VRLQISQFYTFFFLEFFSFPYFLLERRTTMAQ